MTIAVALGRNATKQTNKINERCNNDNLKKTILFGPMFFILTASKSSCEAVNICYQICNITFSKCNNYPWILINNIQIY